MTLKKRMRMPLRVPTPHTSQVAMIPTGPIEQILLTGIRGATNGNVKRVKASAPPMLKEKKTGAREK